MTIDSGGSSYAQSVYNQISDRSKKDKNERQQETRQQQSENVKHSERSLEMRTQFARTETTKGMARTQQIYQKDQMQEENLDLAETAQNLKVASQPPKVIRPMLSTPSAYVTPKTPSEAQEDLSTIVIVQQAMSAIMKGNQDLWKSSWQLVSQNMNMSLSMAKASAQETQANYNSQADATLNQAKMARSTGAVSIGVFAGSMVLGALMPAEPENPNATEEMAGEMPKESEPTEEVATDAAGESTASETAEGEFPTSAAEPEAEVQSPGEAAETPTTDAEEDSGAPRAQGQSETSRGAEQMEEAGEETFAGAPPEGQEAATQTTTVVGGEGAVEEVQEGAAAVEEGETASAKAAQTSAASSNAGAGAEAEAVEEGETLASGGEAPAGDTVTATSEVADEAAASTSAAPEEGASSAEDDLDMEGAAPIGTDEEGDGLAATQEEGRAPEEEPSAEDPSKTTAAEEGTQEDGTGQKLGKFKKFVSGLSDTPGWKMVDKVMRTMQVGQTLSTSINSFIQAKYETRVAANQREAGMHDAASKIYSSYQEFYSTSTQRYMGVQDNINQNISYAKDVWKGTVDGITQWTQSAFA